MRVSLAGVVRNAARCIDELMEELRERCEPEEIEQIESQIQPRSSTFMLREIYKHANEVIDGKEPVREFARHYCLTEKGTTP